MGSVAASRLSSEAFGKRIVLRTQGLLEADSDALRGGLSLTRTVVVEDMSSAQRLVEPMPSWTILALVGSFSVLLLGVICIMTTRRKSQNRMEVAIDPEVPAIGASTSDQAGQGRAGGSGVAPMLPLPPPMSEQVAVTPSP